MPDVFTKAKRSEVMARIRSRGNKDTELALASLFRRHGIKGWRRQIQIITSPRPSPQRGEGVRVRPDFVFPKLRLAVFVDGCFWHACPIHATKPRNNAAFWRKKLAGNKARDRKVNRALRAADWRVLRIWEHELHQRGRRKVEHGKGIRRQSTPRPRREGWNFVRRTSSGLRSPSPQRGEGNLPDQGGEGEARLVAKLRNALAEPGAPRR